MSIFTLVVMKLGFSSSSDAISKVREMISLWLLHTDVSD